jgi:hypothetical protein
VVGVCNDSDLALLKPTDDNFFKDIQPLKIGPMPPLRHRIYVAGFPIGGEEISVTEGVVSRIEIQPYSHSLKQLLAITVDAAINSGNSGGPVMNQHGELIGELPYLVVVAPILMVPFRHCIPSLGRCGKYRSHCSAASDPSLLGRYRKVRQRLPRLS